MYHMLQSAHSSLQSDSIGIAPTHSHQALLRIYILTQTNTCNRFDLEFEPILFAYKRHKIFWLGVFFFSLVLYIKTHSHTPSHKPARAIAIWMWMFTFFYMFFLADEIQLFHLSEFLCWTPENRFSFAILILAWKSICMHDAKAVFDDWPK